MAEKDAPGRAFQPEDLIAGRYRVLEFLGAGNRGEVYAVLDTTSRERVALKTIRSEHAGDPQAIERLRREMVLARGISHTGICRVFDLGQHEATRPIRTVFFLTMELLEGETLEKRLRRQRRMTVSEAEPLVRQLCEALHAAHHGGVLHRDLKAANIFLARGREGLRAVVTDFGLAYALQEENPNAVSLTETGLVVGSPAYMSPEQLRGEALSAASDIYALGVLLFEMVTGGRPLDAATPAGIFLRRSTQSPPSPRKAVPNLDQAWETTILRCLHPEPRRRFQDALMVLAALDGRGGGRRKRSAVLAGLLGVSVLSVALFLPTRTRFSGSQPVRPERSGRGATQPPAVVPAVPCAHRFVLGALEYSTNRAWLDTGLDVEAGETLVVTGSGTACYNPNPIYCFGPDGNPRHAHQSCRFGMLVGRIGSDGAMLCLGADYSRTAATSGRLFLGYADSDYENNADGFEVCVNVAGP